MAFPLLTPRVNNNDDVVRLTKLWVDKGASIRRGLPVADIETDKSVFTIEAEQEGYLLGFMAKEGRHDRRGLDFGLVRLRSR